MEKLQEYRELHVDSTNYGFTLSPEILMDLGQAEQQVVSVKKLEPVNDGPSLRRAFNVKMN